MFYVFPLVDRKIIMAGKGGLTIFILVNSELNVSHEKGYKLLWVYNKRRNPRRH